MVKLNDVKKEENNKRKGQATRDARVPLVRSRGTCLLMWYGALETRLEGCLGWGGEGGERRGRIPMKHIFLPPTSAVVELCSY